MRKNEHLKVLEWLLKHTRLSMKDIALDQKKPLDFIDKTSQIFLNMSSQITKNVENRFIKKNKDKMALIAYSCKIKSYYVKSISIRHKNY